MASTTGAIDHCSSSPATSFQSDKVGAGIVDGVDALLPHDLVCLAIELEDGQPRTSVLTTS
jgi:hypothetical protein